jgi:SNF family Na+-dependent transporter
MAFSLSAAGQNFATVIDYILELIYILIPILSILAFLLFFWGLSKFILSSGNTADIEKGRNYMLWGILALFILLSFRAIISLVSTDLGIGDGTIQPELPTGRN